MAGVHRSDLPHNALLRRYQVSGAYTDCYVTRIAQGVSLAAYVEAFYTTPLFRLERLILKWLVARPSTDEQARLLGTGSLATFAAWTVESRDADQLLLCDLHGRTRSWLMVVPITNGEGSGTLLHFGSAVTPLPDREGRMKRGKTYDALLGCHKLYSRLLLAAARSRLVRIHAIGQARN